MRLKIRALSLLVAVCLTVTTLGNYNSSSAAIESSGAISTDNCSTKISEDLQMVLARSEDDDMRDSLNLDGAGI